MATQQANVQLRRWRGGQHPTLSNITRLMQKEGLRPYMWTGTPNQRQAVRTHGYDKILYVVDGTIDVILPDSNQQVKLRPGDRIDIPAGVRHGTSVAMSGAKCLEASVTRQPERPTRRSRTIASRFLK